MDFQSEGRIGVETEVINHTVSCQSTPALNPDIEDKSATELAVYLNSVFSLPHGVRRALDPVTLFTDAAARHIAEQGLRKFDPAAAPESIRARVCDIMAGLAVLDRRVDERALVTLIRREYPRLVSERASRLAGGIMDEQQFAEAISLLSILGELTSIWNLDRRLRGVLH